MEKWIYRCRECLESLTLKDRWLDHSRRDYSVYKGFDADVIYSYHRYVFHLVFDRDSFFITVEE